MYTIIINQDSLMHHGIKGQKWGVRRFQNPDGSLKSAGKKRYSFDNKKQVSKDSLKNSSKSGFSDLDPDVQSLIINAGMVTAMFASAYVLGKIVKAKNMKHCDQKLNDNYEERDIKTLSDLPKMKKPMSPSENMKLTNPDYPNSGTTTNCMLCTTAMAMREKGFDVKATKNFDSMGFYEENIDKLWSSEGKMKKLKAKDVDKIYSKLEEEDEGSYGNLCVTWAMGGGHSVFWKKENGKVNIYDGQSGEEIKKSQLRGNIAPSLTTYSNLTNAQPTDLLLGAVRRR